MCTKLTKIPKMLLTINGGKWRLKHECGRRKQTNKETKQSNLALNKYPTFKEEKKVGLLSKEENNCSLLVHFLIVFSYFLVTIINGWRFHSFMNCLSSIFLCRQFSLANLLFLDFKIYRRKMGVYNFIL